MSLHICIIYFVFLFLQYKQADSAEIECYTSILKHDYKAACDFFSNSLPFDFLSQWSVLHYWDLMLHLECAMKRASSTASMYFGGNTLFKENTVTRGEFINKYISEGLGKCDKYVLS